jgi:peroxiredoxin
MALTESTMLDLGHPAPDFELPDVVSGRTVRLTDFDGQTGLLVMFLCAHCPFVIHVKHELSRLGRDYAGKSLGMVAISANYVGTHPQDAPANLKRMAEELGFVFPFTYDETQETAKAYNAACTPDFFLFDAERRLAYRGQLDDSRPGNGIPVSGQDLRAAIDAVLAGQPVNARQKPSIGCNIKWRPGNEPAYAR